MKLTRSFAEMTPEKRPQDSHLGRDRPGGEYPDTMPQAIKLIDAEGRRRTKSLDQRG